MSDAVPAMLTLSEAARAAARRVLQRDRDVTFGGAYAVPAYVAQAAVEQYH